MAKGVIDVVGSSDFDGMGYRWNWFKAGERMMEDSEVSGINEMLEGDLAYYKNYENYYALHGPWQGENIIKVKDGKFWGQGPGEVDEDALIRLLKKNNNNNNNNDEKKRGEFIGFVDKSNHFTNITRLGMNVFDYRNKKKRGDKNK